MKAFALIHSFNQSLPRSIAEENSRQVGNGQMRSLTANSNQSLIVDVVNITVTVTAINCFQRVPPMVFRLVSIERNPVVHFCQSPLVCAVGACLPREEKTKKKNFQQHSPSVEGERRN